MYSRLNHCLQCKNSHFCHRSCNSSLSCHCTQQFTYRAFLPTAAELDLIAPPKPAAAAINIYDIFAHFRQFWKVWPCPLGQLTLGVVPIRQCLVFECIECSMLRHLQPTCQSTNYSYSIIGDILALVHLRRRAFNMKNGQCVAPSICHLHRV